MLHVVLGMAGSLTIPLSFCNMDEITLIPLKLFDL